MKHCVECLETGHSVGLFFVEHTDNEKGAQRDAKPLSMFAVVTLIRTPLGSRSTLAPTVAIQSFHSGVVNSYIRWRVGEIKM